jgi:formamidopyrimidine-DNA glycosylase
LIRYAAFARTFDAYAQACDKPIKAFLASASPIAGIGNGYLQDILFGCGLHPRNKVRSIAAGQQKKLHRAIRKVLTEAVAKGGRDSEYDLFGRPGGYVSVMDRRAVSRPCPKCGSKIETFNFMGGSCYVCPKCQPRVD